MLKCCLSGTMVTIWKVCFLMLDPHTQLTTSLITVLSHSNSSYVGDEKMKIVLVKLLSFW